MTRRLGMLASLAVLAPSLAVAVSGPASAASACGDLVSATIPAGFEASAHCDTFDGSRTLTWNVMKTGGGYDLGSGSLGQTFAMTFDAGTISPRVTFTRGADVAITRTKADDGHWHVKVTAKPVLSTEECNMSAWPWTCPDLPTLQRDGYLGGDVTDYGSWEDAEQRAAMFGMDVSTNIEAISLPPEVVQDPRSGAEMIMLRLANTHYYRPTPSTTATFKGFVHVKIPNAFLKAVYGIDAPATLTSSGLAPTVGTGTGTVSVTDTGSALAVDAEDLTFSMRTLKVHRGTIVPRKPTYMAAKRTGATTAKLTFRAATARGSKVTGHLARCVARTGRHVVTDREYNGSPQYVFGLRRGVAYDCTVRGTSKAGPGTKSVVVRVRRTA